MVDIIKLKEAYIEYKKEVFEWLDSNTLVILPEYHKLHDKETWGANYRKDQIYYEIVADYKSKLYGVRSAAFAVVTDVTTAADRINKKQAEILVEDVDNELKALDNHLFKARARLQFYENIMRVISNVTFGSY